MKDSRKLERIFKGMSNHWRIEILLIVKKNPNISLLNIAQKLNANMKTISEHTKKLVIAGLIKKKYSSREVMHSLSPYGEKIFKIIKTF